jgi:hypothetical protein
MKQGILSVAGNIQSFWIFSQLSYFFVRLWWSSTSIYIFLGCLLQSVV